MKKLSMRKQALKAMDDMAQHKNRNGSAHPRYSLQQPSAWNTDEIIHQYAKANWRVTTFPIMRITGEVILHLKRFKIPLFAWDQDITKVTLAHTRGDKITFAELKYLRRVISHYCSTTTYIYDHDITMFDVRIQNLERMITIQPVQRTEIIINSEDPNEHVQLTPWNLVKLTKP